MDQEGEKRTDQEGEKRTDQEGEKQWTRRDGNGRQMEQRGGVAGKDTRQDSKTLHRQDNRTGRDTGSGVGWQHSAGRESA